MKYRPDIDGLRAIAVLMVIVFHFRRPALPAGFIGVDIFMVVSGYLITQFIVHELAADRFSFKVFFFRRARRILPALFFVVASTLLAGGFFFLPKDLESLSSSSISAVLCSSNIYFYLKHGGYFGQKGSEIPLLHTWSLGLEEQFYLVWPVLVVIILRFFRPRNALLIIAALSACSFIIAEQALRLNHSMFAFYLLPPRAGEFLMGGYLALAEQNGKLKGASVRLKQFISAIGAVFILAPAFLMSSFTLFPGINSLYPCLGTVFIIWSGNDFRTFISRILSLRLVVYVGLISYSLYLWHWPIYVFLNYTNTNFFMRSLAGLCLAFLLATLTYLFVERPCRKIAYSKARSFLVLMLVSTAGLVLVAVIFLKMKGLDGITVDSPAYKEGLEQTRAETDYGAPFICKSTEIGDVFAEKKCIIGDPTKRPSGLLWGDSHAGHYSGFLHKLGVELGFSLRNVMSSSCPPFIGPLGKYRRTCADFMSRIKTELNNYPSVVVGAAWQNYSNLDGQFLNQLDLLLDYLQSLNKPVILLSQVPEFDHYDRFCSLKRLRMPWLKCNDMVSFKNEGDMKANIWLEEEARKYPNIAVINIRDLICDNERCSAYVGGRPVYYDTDHLSFSGAQFLAEKFLSAHPRLLNLPNAFQGFLQRDLHN